MKRCTPPCFQNEPVLNIVACRLSPPIAPPSPPSFLSALPFRYNVATDCLGAGVRVGGEEADGHQYGVDNSVS